jgi:putative tryptophan/tyrosine transport system substrate-binding protein
VRRREVVALLGGVATWPLVAEAQQTPGVPRIGLLWALAPQSRVVEAFRSALADLGYVDGRTAVLESRFSSDRYDRLPALAAELVQLDVDVLVAAPAPAVIAAKAASGRIPIVMIGVADPVGQGLVASLARPGGNVTGLSFTVGTETFGKFLELLRETVPNLRRVAVLVNPSNPAQALVRQDLAVAAEWLGLQLHAVEATGPEDFEGAFAAMAREGAGAVLIVGDPAFEAHNPRLADLGIRYGLASMHQLRHRVEAGGLMSYGPDIVDLWRRAAPFVDKLLRGARASDLPIQQPTTFELVVNLKTAKALGLTVPPALLARADEVIE